MTVVSLRGKSRSTDNGTSARRLVDAGENGGDAGLASGSREREVRPAAPSAGTTALVMRRRNHTQQLVPCVMTSADPHADWSLESASFGDVAIGAFASAGHRLEVAAADADRAPGGLMIDFITCGGYELNQDGRVGRGGPGDGVIFVNRIPFRSQGQGVCSSRSVMLPDTLLAPHLGDLSRLAAVVLCARHPAVMLLSSYLSAIRLGAEAPEPAVRGMVGGHIVDLLVSAITASIGKEDPTQGTGVRAARLGMIKRLIDTQVSQPTLNAARVARHFGLSDRYVQKLLEEAGTTFSAYVMERRLSLARQRLGDCAFASMSVREVAWSVGFSDPAHFTRSFRHRFGETPTSVRGGAALSGSLAISA